MILFVLILPLVAPLRDLIGDLLHLNYPWQYYFIPLVAYVLIWVVVKYVFIGSFRRRLDVPAKNPDNIEAIGKSLLIVLSILYVGVYIESTAEGLGLEPGDLFLHLVCIFAIVWFGLSKGTGRREFPEQEFTIDSSPKPNLDENDFSNVGEIEDISVDCNSGFNWVFYEEPHKASGSSFRKMNLDLTIPETLYDDYKSITRDIEVSRESELAAFACAELNDEVMSLLAKKIDRLSSKYGYEYLQRLHLVLAFIQSIPYQSVTQKFESGNNKPKYPVEILSEGGGDCADHAILAAGLLAQLGYITSMGFNGDQLFIAVDPPRSIDIPKTLTLGVSRKVVLEITPEPVVEDEQPKKVCFWYGSNPGTNVQPAQYIAIAVVT